MCLNVPPHAFYFSNYHVFLNPPPHKQCRVPASSGTPSTVDQGGRRTPYLSHPIAVGEVEKLRLAHDQPETSSQINTTETKLIQNMQIRRLRRTITKRTKAALVPAAVCIPHLRGRATL